MFISHLSLTRAAVSVVAFYIVYQILSYIYWHLTTGAARRKIIKERGCKPLRRVPTKDPFFGIDFVYNSAIQLKRHNILQWQCDLIKSMGFTTGCLPVPHKTVFSTIEPKVVQTILSLDFHSFGLGSARDGLKPFLGEGIFSTDGAAWQHSRNLLRPCFVRSQVGDVELLERHLQQLLLKIPRDGSMVDLQPLFFKLTLDTSTHFLFGESTGCLDPNVENELSLEFAAAFDRCQSLSDKNFLLVVLDELLPEFLKLGSQFKKDVKMIHNFVDTIISRSLSRGKVDSEPSKTYVFLHELISQTTDIVKIRSELLNVLLAGRDTTASFLSNIWFELSRHPEIWARLRPEVDGLNDELPSFTQLKDMKYLKAVLNETLRLYPIVPGNGRQALTDTVVPVGGGEDGLSPFFVPKGTMFAWDVYTMHRRKDFYGEDAEVFRPERWLDEDGRKGLRPGWEYLPFNGGPRICLGRRFIPPLSGIQSISLQVVTMRSWDTDSSVEQFALTEASYTTVRLMQEFGSIESRDSEPWTERLNLSCTGLNGCKVSLTPHL
jgi:cytochrome P450